jgi:hypothetical protein
MRLEDVKDEPDEMFLPCNSIGPCHELPDLLPARDHLLPFPE